MSRLKPFCGYHSPGFYSWQFIAFTVRYPSQLFLCCLRQSSLFLDCSLRFDSSANQRPSIPLLHYSALSIASQHFFGTFQIYAVSFLCSSTPSQIQSLPLRLLTILLFCVSMIFHSHLFLSYAVLRDAYPLLCYSSPYGSKRC